MKKRSLLSFATISVLAIGLLAGCTDSSTSGSSSSSSDSSSNVSADSTSSQSSSSSSDSTSSSSAKTISKSEFGAIKDGMTLSQVAKIVGSKGTLESESGTKGSPYYTAIYTWDGDQGFGANASVTFQAGKVINKSQFGVDNGSKATITLAKFNKIQNGMTYEQVQKVIGGKGSVDSESGTKGSPDYTLMISYNGSDLGANAILTFQANKMIDKTQMGLK